MTASRQKSNFLSVTDTLLQAGAYLLSNLARIDNKAITIFWTPYAVGAFGFSIESQFTEDGSSGISTGLQDYALLVGNPQSHLL